MYHEQIISITEKIIQDFGNLDSNQLNWKHSDKSWSIGQCFDHLIRTNEQYMNKLYSVNAKDFRMSFWEKFNPLTDYTGKSLIQSLGEIVSKKYINPKLFAPVVGCVRPDIIQVFVNHQEKLKDLFRNIEENGHLQKVISSPVAPLITLRISDSLQLIVEHEKRHVRQAKNVLESVVFTGFQR
jgi:hypothetical protein